MGTAAGLKGEDIMTVCQNAAIASPMNGLKGPKVTRAFAFWQ